MRIVSLLPSATEIVADLGLLGSLVGRSVHHFEIDQLATSMAKAGSDAVTARITSSDHHDFLPFGRNVLTILELAIEQAGRVLREELHGKMNAL